LVITSPSTPGGSVSVGAGYSLGSVAAADDLATTAAERACLVALRDLAGGADSAMERHCVRVYEIAVEVARRRGLEVDRELLLCAALLHDAGIYPAAASDAAYVTDGRRLAARVLAPFGWPEERLERCGGAIERHHALRSQWAAGAEVEVLRRADLVGLSGGLVRAGLDGAWLRDLARRVPRRGLMRALLPLIGRMIRDRPATVPRIFASRR
jgi:HD domain